MTGPRFRIEPLDKHARSNFDCGSTPLDSYLRTQASQDVRRNVSACYVAVDLANAAVAGYYTLAATSIKLVELPEKIAKKLPRYPLVPAGRIGRLAVDQAYQGHRLGGILLFDAIGRVVRSGIGFHSVVVDAKDESAAAFYEHHGFLRLTDAPRTLFLPLSDELKRRMTPDGP